MPEYPLRTFVHAAAETELDASARAEALSWSPNTRRAYVANWKDFTKWCIWNRCAGLPTTPSDVACYLEHLVETEGKTLAIASPRQAVSRGARHLARTRWTRPPAGESRSMRTTQAAGKGRPTG